MSFSDSVGTNAPDTSSAELMTGRVKWFNNKSGYGFLTVTDGSRTGSDIFVHHSAVLVSSQQYKYLVQGEYVEFKLVSIEGGSHDVQAADVCGIKGGKLMCETRRDFRMARTSYKSSSDQSEVDEVKTPRSVKVRQASDEPKTPRVRGSGPRGGDDWQFVKTPREQRAAASGGRGNARPRQEAKKAN